MATKKADSKTSGRNTRGIGLSEILRSLERHRITGTLKVEKQDGQRAYIYFKDGVIQHLKARIKRVLLGQVLVKQGALKKEELDEALERQAGSKERVGIACMRLGYISEGELRGALKEQFERELLALLEWKEPTSEFQRGEPPLDIFDFDDLACPVELQASQVVNQQRKRNAVLGEVKRIIPSLYDIYTPTASSLHELMGGGTADSNIQAVLRLVDGKRDVREILEATKLDEMSALLALGELVKEGRLAALNPVQLMRVAAESEKSGQLRKSLRCYQRAKELDFDQFDLPNRMAKVFRKLGQDAHAIRCWFDFAQKAEEEALPEMAIATYRKILEINPGHVPSHEALYKLLKKKDRVSEAAQALKALIAQIDPERQREKLVKAWQQVIKLCPEDREPRLKLAELHLQAEDKAQAVLTLEELAQIDLEQGEPEEAIKVLRMVLEIDPECVAAHLELANTLAELGDKQEAVEEYQKLAESLARSGVTKASSNWMFLMNIFEQIIELEPDNQKARAWLAKGYADREEINKARNHYRGLLTSLKRSNAAPKKRLEPLEALARLDPEDFQIRAEWGATLRGLGRDEKARKVFSELAQAALKAKCYHEALTASQRVLELAPFELEAHRTVARIHSQEERDQEAFEKHRDILLLTFHAGLYDQAAQAARHALEFFPDDSESRHLLARIHERQGEVGKAAQAYLRVAELELERENLGRARDAAEKASELAPDSSTVGRFLERLEAARHRGPIQEEARSAARPTITGGVTISEPSSRSKSKGPSIVGIADKLKQVSLGSSNEQKGGSLRGIRDKLKAMKSGNSEIKGEKQSGSSFNKALAKLRKQANSELGDFKAEGSSAYDDEAEERAEAPAEKSPGPKKGVGGALAALRAQAMSELGDGFKPQGSSAYVEEGPDGGDGGESGETEAEAPKQSIGGALAKLKNIKLGGGSSEDEGGPIPQVGASAYGAEPETPEPEEDDGAVSGRFQAAAGQEERVSGGGIQNAMARLKNLQGGSSSDEIESVGASAYSHEPEGGEGEDDGVDEVRVAGNSVKGALDRLSSLRGLGSGGDDTIQSVGASAYGHEPEEPADEEEEPAPKKSSGGIGGALAKLKNLKMGGGGDDSIQSVGASAYGSDPEAPAEQPETEEEQEDRNAPPAERVSGEGLKGALARLKSMKGSRGGGSGIQSVGASAYGEGDDGDESGDEEPEEGESGDEPEIAGEKAPGLGGALSRLKSLKSSSSDEDIQQVGASAYGGGDDAE